MAINANDIHEGRLSVQDKIALTITNAVGTMFCVYLFVILGGLSLYGALTNNQQIVLIFGGLSSYFLQLVLLPLIMVGQSVQSRHSEIRAELEFETTQREEMENRAILENNKDILLRLERVEKQNLEQLELIKNMLKDRDPGMKGKN